MFLAVNTELMMTLATGVCIGLLVIIGVPLLMGLWRFIKELIQQTKDAQSYLYEVMDDDRAGYFAQYLQNEMALQQTIGETGVDAYRKEQRNAHLKKYGVWLAAGAILLVLAVLLNRWSIPAWVQLMERMGVIQNFSYACLAGSVVLFLYYLCCQKRQRKKWKACFAIAIIGAAHFAGRMLGIPAPIPMEAAIPVFLALGAFHYNKWKKGVTEMTEILQYRLNEKRYAKNPVVADYLALQTMREHNGYNGGLMQHDDEVDEMLIYLSWLEQSKAR